MTGFQWFYSQNTLKSLRNELENVGDQRPKSAPWLRLKSKIKWIKKYIEDSNLCYRKYDNDQDGVPESNRFYHALMRGLILNELFRRTEPKHRSMNEYFKQEIVPILSKNDNKKL